MQKEKRVCYDPTKDPKFQRPYIDIDELREREGVQYRYVHGGFEGTELRFSLYFPQKNYKGRFFHFMAPIPTHEDASQHLKGERDMITFAITHGAYFVESNMGGYNSSNEDIYRNSAAVAEYSRVIAQRLYGEHRPYGYISGGSGGGYKTISCVENTDVWDGAVPFVIGSPVALPNVFTVRAHALRVLRNKITQIADAMEPGGSGDMYAGLNQEEKEALKEATRMGLPVRAWFWFAKREWFVREYDVFGALPLFIPVMEKVDPQYFEDFWTVPGYLGADPNSSAVRDRIQHRTVIVETHLIDDDTKIKIESTTGVDDAWQRFKNFDITVIQPWIRLESVPEGKDLYLTGTNIVFLTGDAAGQKVPLERLEGNKAFISEGFGIEGMLEILKKVKPGDEVMLDNSNFIALQTYHRHQVPSRDFHVWDQFRNDDGKPIYPQRPFLLASHILGNSIQSGCYNGKMIVVASLLDVDALPWQADWYRNKIKEVLGKEESERFRLWYIDNAMHGEPDKPGQELYFVSYLGAVYQALLDLSNWVERGIAPPESTNYSVIDGQVFVPLQANERKGIQPVVDLRVNGSKCVVVSVGDSVYFKAEVEVPKGVGKLTSAEWSFEGETGYPIKGEFNYINGDYTKATVEGRYVYNKPGTYFAVLRVMANREGDQDDKFTQVMNLDRVRVIVKERKLEPWMKLSTEGLDIKVREIREFNVPDTGYDTNGRIYYPDGEGPFPVLFYIHGGGFIGGFNLMDEPICRKICHDVGCAVISPNYQLAPENKWPTAINELYALLQYFSRNAMKFQLDMSRIAIGGSSAGGNLAAALCVKAHQTKAVNFRYLVLIYPALDLRLDNDDKVDSLTDVVAMPPSGLGEMVKLYVPGGEDYKNPLISPIYAPAEAFPKTCIFCGRKDLLWKEGKAFADKLIDAGVEVLYKCYENAGHGFMELAGGEYISRNVKNLICDELKRALIETKNV